MDTFKDVRNFIFYLKRKNDDLFGLQLSLLVTEILRGVYALRSGPFVLFELLNNAYLVKVAILHFHFASILGGQL